MLSRGTAKVHAVDDVEGCPPARESGRAVALPPLLLEGWQSAFDARHGKTYFYNRSTGERTWTRPSQELPCGTAPAKRGVEDGQGAERPPEPARPADLQVAPERPARTDEPAAMPVDELGRTPAASSRQRAPPLHERPIVQFASSTTYAKDESSKSFNIKLKDNDRFDSVVEVPLELYDNRRCDLGEYLWRTRIKVIDDDTFPSKKFEEDIYEDPTCDSWKAHNNFNMAIEFARFCLQTNRPGSYSVLVGDQIQNVIYVAQLALGRELINMLSAASMEAKQAGGGSPDDYINRLALIAVLLTLPYLFSHIYSYRKQFWKVGGAARKALLEGLMLRFLYYNECSRDLLNETELRQTFHSHIFTLVADGYMTYFKIAAAFGRLAMLFVYFAYGASRKYAETNEPYQYFFLSVFVMIPAFVAGYVLLRSPESTRVREAVEDAKIDLVQHIDSVVSSYRAVADCGGRPQALHSCTEKVVAVNRWLAHQAARTANDVAFFGWAKEIVECFVIIVGGYFVVKGYASLGTFTASMAGLAGATQQFAEVYKAALAIQSTYPCMWHLVEYMNHPMDLKERLEVQEESRELLDEKFRLAKADARVVSNQMVAEDAIPIELDGVRFKFPVPLEDKLRLTRLSCKDARAQMVLRTPSDRATSSWSLSAMRKDGKRKEGKPTIMSKNISLQIQQGELLAVEGGHGDGKGTLLRLLTSVLLQTDGKMFVPSHLRVMNLELSEQLLNGSVAYNVYFGLLACRGKFAVGDLEPQELERGVRICKLLQMPHEVVKAVENFDSHEGSALKSVSSSTRVKMQIARALIANPEVLVAHRPVDSLHSDQAKLAMDLLREFVTHRGVGFQGGSSEDRRRPRTCIFTSCRRSILALGDRIYQLGGDALPASQAFSTPAEASPSCPAGKRFDSLHSIEYGADNELS